MMTIVYNINTEAGDEAVIDRMVEFVREKEIELGPESNIVFRADGRFSTWNGGEGYRTGGVYLRFEGYGRVDNFEEARKALGFMLSGGNPPYEWPTSDEIETALEIVEQMKEINNG